MAITISDVAERAQVSISTVSRYMADKNSVKELTAAKIAKVISETGFIPNCNARNLKRGHSNVVGLITPDLTLELFSKVAKVLNEFLYEYGYLLIVCDSGFSPAKERMLVNSLIQQNAALIIVATNGNNASFLNEIAQKTNRVLLFDRMQADVMADCVTERHEENAYNLIRFLHSTGRLDIRHFHVLTGPSSSPITDFRLAGIHKALKSLGLALRPDQLTQDLTSVDLTREAVLSLLKHPNRPKSLFFTTPKCISGIFQACWETGIEINRDLLLSGFATADPKWMYNMSFPCIIQNSSQLGLVLGSQVLKRLKKPSASLTHKLITVDSILFEGD